MEPKFQVQLKIRKPAAEVFDAVVNPKKLAGYFVAKATGPLEAGKTVKWSFPEPQFSTPFDVTCREVVKNERIVFEWPSPEGSGGMNRVEMTFTPLDAGNTMVAISESGWSDTEKGYERAFGNNAGWMHMVMSLKGYLEYGINLREGGVM